MRRSLRRAALLVAFTTAVALPAARAQSGPRGPIIDMHLHAEHVADYGPTPTVCSDNRGIVWNGWDPRTPLDPSTVGACAAALWHAPKTDGDLLRQTITMLERHDIRAVTTGTPEDLAAWVAASPRRIIPAVNFFRPGRDAQGRPLYRDTAELRRLVRDGKVAVFAEITAQYRGMSPADPTLDPYFALAEELDVPVGLHMGEGPPGGPNVPGYEHYRVALGNPLLLEPVLVRHPKLRLYVMHFGSPFVDDMIAMLFSYPQLYVDVSQNDWGFPRAHFLAQLRRLVDAGFGQRILFGSDQMIWPQAIDLSIETIESAGFLTSQQKRDILHDNAVRFLRLDDRRPAPANPGRRGAPHDSVDRRSAVIPQRAPRIAHRGYREEH